MIILNATITMAIVNLTPVTGLIRNDCSSTHLASYCARNGS